MNDIQRPINTDTITITKMCYTYGKLKISKNNSSVYVVLIRQICKCCAFIMDYAVGQQLVARLFPTYSFLEVMVF